MEKNTPFHTLRQSSRQIMDAFIKGEEASFSEGYTRILDDYFRDSFEESIIGPRLGITKNPYAIIALGGYGRGEQCVHSDVDLLFLFEPKVPREAENLIKEVVYPLWDLGLDIGYATRSIKECISLASKDIEVLTSLLDARFLCGASLLYSRLMEQMRARILVKRPKKVIEQLVESNRQRHGRFGDSAYLLEPNLKEGQGGIRDYHTMLWIARIESDIHNPRDLERCGYLTSAAYQNLSGALSFIWKVRSHLHYLSGRKCDQLHLEYQTRLARRLNYVRDNGQKPVEKFLGELHGNMEILKQHYLLFVLEQGYGPLQKKKSKSGSQTGHKDLELVRGMIFFRSSESILTSPGLLMKVFEESQHLKSPLSGEAKQLVREFSYLVDDDFRKDPAMLRSFERILTSPAQVFNVLSEMLETGFLMRFIPPFKNIINRIQYNEYHLYPVDRHSLRAVQAVKNFSKEEENAQTPLCHGIYRELSGKKLLIWAAFLHDIGKGEPGGGHAEKGAKIARKLLTDFGFKQKDIDTVAFLIENHLFLANTATRRDINDEETAIFCARHIKELGRLKLLYLLTVADSISTGPKAWNEWTAALLRNLFLKVLNILEKGELASKQAIKTVETKKERVLESVSSGKEKKAVLALLDVMSPRYLLYASSNEIIQHSRLYHSLGDEPFVLIVEEKPDANTRTVTVCAHDRPGLFSKIAGTFTLNGLNILDSQIFTWRNNIALDIFEVEAPVDRLFEKDRWDRVKESLRSALTGKLDLATALSKKGSDFASKPGLSDLPDRVIVDNRSSSFFTIIEVFTYDFPGLLFKVTDAIFRCGLDIWVAKIATKIDQVVDVFYVRDFDGQKVDTALQERAIQNAIAAVLPNASSEEPVQMRAEKTGMNAV